MAKKNKVNKPTYRTKLNKKYANGGEVPTDAMLGGAMQGVSMGSSLGPWGMLVGGLAGAGKAIVDHSLDDGAIDTKGRGVALNREQQMRNSYSQQQTQFAEGGQLNEFNGGGTHEQNPLGGIPVGNGNSVESGETELTSENYVFSDRLTLLDSGCKLILSSFSV